MAAYSSFTQNPSSNGIRRKPLPVDGHPMRFTEDPFFSRGAHTTNGVVPTAQNNPEYSSAQHPQDATYDVQNTERRRSTIKSISTILTKSITGVSTPKSPWQHEKYETGKDLADETSGTVRVFNHHRQRRRLFISGGLRWLLTAVLCGGMAGSLAGFQSIPGLTTAQKHIFNALVTFFSMAIGFSLASSMRLYAQMMRWRFLASRYRTLQEFEDILKCEDQLNCMKMLLSGRKKSRPLLSLTRVLALVSLAVNLFLQVITALVGLTYSVEVSSTFVISKKGNVSIVNLSSIVPPLGYGKSFPTSFCYVREFRRCSLTLSRNDSAFDYQCTAAYGYGMAGASYPNKTSEYTPWPDDDWTSYYCNYDQSTCWYWFWDQSTNGNLSEVSNRTVSSTATCQNLTVLQGGYAGREGIDFQSPNVQYEDEDGKVDWLDVPTSFTLPRSSTFIGNSTEGPCGPRCSEIFVLVSADNDTIPKPLLFRCQNNISQVINYDPELTDPSQYELPADSARALAGAIGFTGFTGESNISASLEYVLYPDGSRWSPEGTYTNGLPMENSEDAAVQTAALIMQFSMGAIDAMDTVGPRRIVNDRYPASDLVVDVEWHWTILILAGIPATQLIVLVCVIIWANEAIIKDDSCLSTARLLRPVVDRLGDHGCLLTGEEIAKELDNFKIIYGVRAPDNFENNSAVNHLDVIQESERLPTSQRMPAGRYDGMGDLITHNEPGPARSIARAKKDT